MKTIFRVLPAALAVGTVIFAAVPAIAQESSVQPSSAVATVHLDYGASQILQMAQAKVNDDTLIAYIKNSGNSYALNADQIIYLRQQGVSDAVITTMLNQPRVGLTAPAAPSTASQPAAESTPATTVVTAPAPTVTYVQPAPVTTYYYYDYAPAYYPYYPAYRCSPSVSFSFGWGGHWGGGWHGGWHRHR